MIIDVNWAFCGDDFTVNANTESFCCTLEINIILCQLYRNKNNKIKISKAVLKGIYPPLEKKIKIRI